MIHTKLFMPEFRPLRRKNLIISNFDAIFYFLLNKIIDVLSSIGGLTISPSALAEVVISTILSMMGNLGGDDIWEKTSDFV